MRFNIFRNPHVDAQVGMLLGSFDQAIRNQSEDYWREEIVKEINKLCQCNHCNGLSLLVRRKNRGKML